MSLTIEVPRPLDEELIEDAAREGVTATDHATLLLYLATALLKEEHPTPFQGAVRSFLAHRSLDADQIAVVLDELVAFCIKAPTGEGKTAAALNYARQHEVGQLLLVLPDWRNLAVHQPIDISPDVIISSGPPLDRILQAGRRVQRKGSDVGAEVTSEQERDPERVARVRSIRGMLAHTATGLASEELHQERQRDKEREESRIQGLRS